VISTGRVLARAATATWCGDFIQRGRTISFRVVDPTLKRCEGPTRSASAEMYRRGKSLSRDPSVKCWATQRSYSQDIAKSKEGRRYRRAFADAGMLASKGAQAFVGGFSRHSMRPLAKSERCPRIRARPERSLEQGACTCRRLPSHSSTSVRSHPMGRPRNWCFFGNLPTNARAVRSQQWRRVSRATSCEVRISFHAGKRSLTQRESGTSAGAAIGWLTVRRTEWSIHMARSAHDVWFRWLRDELSLRCKYEFPRQRRNGSFAEFSM
jgi:hypothetical protein